MPVTHFDIDDQWNPDNIAEARNFRDSFDPLCCRHSKAVWDAMDSLEDCDDEAVEVHR